MEDKPRCYEIPPHCCPPRPRPEGFSLCCRGGTPAPSLPRTALSPLPTTHLFSWECRAATCRVASSSSLTSWFLLLFNFNLKGEKA